ncbi:ATP-dependent helicase [Deinococcus sp. VB343]|uniref:DNA 3'-5' helicase n=1 Tax=Deinococcus sp. VB142 TaxID=3112952 RepID=A0AAU6Q5B4_9DEIO
MTTDALNFTPEQQQIVQHDAGHALVYAVAGSGKTTTLVGRIRHLIREKHVRPVRILATTFTRDARRSLELKLAQYPECAGVEVLTLHALATRIVTRGQEMGFTELVIGEDGFSQRLFAEARKRLLEELSEDEREVAARLKQLAYKDFDVYLGIQKGNLRLPYIPGDLPEAAAALITAPDAGPDVYARLYAKHDELRRFEGKLDFDDLIVAAWMLMERFPALHRDISSRWDYVNIDEFQDVNLAQSEMMHLVASQAKSYMAIGDDDQTIYQWRGAHPRFILGFAKRYEARQFTLPSNFRCPMGVIALADKVIAENKVRVSKRLRATRGGSGVQVHPEQPGAAARIAIKAVQEGRSPEEVVILLRTYAQSAEIEQVFLQEKIPYRLVGTVPFYRRAEVTILTAYLELALADFDVLNGESFTTPRRERLQKLWRSVANRPSRYLRTNDVESIARLAWRDGRTLAQVVQEYATNQADHVRKPLSLLGTWLEFLTEDIGTSPGKDVLLDFVNAIEYRAFLIKTAPTTEFGEERAGSVDALAEMAQTRSLGSLITHLAELHEQVRYEESLQRRGEDDQPRITIMTAFRAKGLEWPVVIVPDCVTGVFSNKPSADAAASEEERRVFYVAITRAQEELHLIVGDDDNTTDFLKRVSYESVVGQHDRLAGLLARDPGTWSAGDTFEAAELLGRYEHEAFIQRWVDRPYRARLLGRFEFLRRQLKGQQEETSAIERVLDLTTYAQHGPLEIDEAQAEFQDLQGWLTVQRATQATPDSLAVEGRKVDALGRRAVDPLTLKAGDRVQHARLGAGEVLQVTPPHEVLIRFEQGSKRVDLRFMKLERL